MLLVTGIASGQTAEPKPLPAGPHEEYDDPPAPLPLWGTGVSPGMVSQEGPFTSRQVNVNLSGQNITGDAANEPSIAVDPTDHNRMVIGWRQFNSVTSNFRQGGWGYTTNAGTTWTFPGVLENNVFRSDPVLACDATGRFLYLSLLETYDVTLWRSLNGGQTFTNIGPAKGGDKQWFAVDNTASIGHGFLYQFWDYASPFAPKEFSRSTDGGFTWMDPIDVPNAPQWGTPDVDSNGTLFFGGVTQSLTQFWCIRSTDARNGAVTPTFDQVTEVNMGGVISYFDTVNPEGLIGQVFLAVDRSGTSSNNNVYMLASVQPTGFNTGSDVMFVRSTDSGATFSSPKRVNDDPVNHSKWHWFGTFAVAPNGRIDSVWLDTRNAANNTNSQLFYSYSLDAGNTWSPNVAVSIPFNPFLGYPNQNKLGDYMTIASDNTGGDVAYAATFNSEQDIYYVRVAPGIAPTPTPSPTPTATATVPPSPTPTPASPTPTPSGTPTPSPSEAPRIDIAVNKGDAPDPVQVGQNLTYTITVSNGGPHSAPNVMMSDTLPASVNFVSVTASQGSCSGTSDVTCHLGSLVAFSSATVTLVVTPTVPGALSNQASAWAAGIDSNLGNNVSNAATTVVPAGVATPTPGPRVQAINLSTRMRVQTSDNVGIGGFILTGNAPKRVILRAIGPSLTQSGVPGALADPVMELHGPGAFATITNDNWRDTQAAEIKATFIPPPDNLESAIVATLAPGPYTAIVSGQDQTSGVALVEVYDLDHSPASKLANLSTRAFVDIADQIVIAGFVLNGVVDDRIVVRGIGPSLTALGVAGALANPALELRDDNGALVIANDDWQDDPAQAAELTAAGLAPTDDLESGIAATLSPGLYTALLAGLNNGTGVGLVEVYERGEP